MPNNDVLPKWDEVVPVTGTKQVPVAADLPKWEDVTPLDSTKEESTLSNTDKPLTYMEQQLRDKGLIVDNVVPKELTFKPNLDFYKASKDVIPSYNEQIKDLQNNEAIQLEDSHRKIIEADQNIQNIATVTGRTPDEVKDITNYAEFVKSLNPRKTTPEESYLAAPVRGLYNTIGDALLTASGASNKFLETLGFNPPSSGLVSDAGKYLKDAAETLKATPDDAIGDLSQNMGSIAGLIFLVELMPEIATPGLAIGGITIAKTVPKLPLFLGAEKSLKAYADSNDPLAPVTEFGKGFLEGEYMTSLGTLSRGFGNIVEKATLSPTLGETAAATASGLLFGTDATAKEYADTGDISSRTFLANFGIGAAFHLSQLKSKLMENAQQKAVTSFFNASPESIKQSIEAPKTKSELRKKAIELRQEAFNVDGQERNQYLLAASMADKTADIKAISDDVALDKEKYIEGINRDNTLTQERKDETIGIVSRVAEYQKSKTDEFDKAQKASARKAEEDRKLAEDLLKAEKDSKLEKTETPEAKTKINDKFQADSDALKAQKIKDIDSSISEAQKRLNMPTEPEVRIDADTDITLGKIENNEPVTNEFIKSASDNLYQEYKGLEVMKSSDLRKFTIEQIEAKQKELGDQITELENYKAKQAEESKFITDKTEAVPETKPAEEVIPQEAPKAEEAPIVLEAPEKEITPETEVKITESTGIKPKNLRDVYKAGREIFGLNRVQSLAQAVVVDRVIRTIAKRRGITKDVVYREIEFKKADELSGSKEGVYFQAAWHGSPYQFDKFRLSQIGTGEGAQAFGWGLYFTDLKGVAEEYAKQNQGNTGAIKAANKGLESSEVGRHIISVIEGGYIKNNEDLLDKLERDIVESEQMLERHDSPFDDYYRNLLRIRKNAHLYAQQEGIIFPPDRNLYKVELHEGKTPDQYDWLVWDKIVPDDLLNKLGDKISKNGYTLTDAIQSITRKGELSGLGRPVKGKDLYDKIISLLGSDKDASLFLLENGIDGIKYPAESIARGTTSDNARGFNYVVFDENAVTIKEVIQFQKDLQKNKGAVALQDSKAIIYALTSPDVSTPLHEIAHVYERSMTDFERKAVLKWSKDSKWTVATSEKFARGFEKYLAEGKAPSVELRKVFEKFKVWLTDIYNGITGSEIDLKLNKPMRDIYDQMLGKEPISRSEETKGLQEDTGSKTTEAPKPTPEEKRAAKLKEASDLRAEIASDLADLSGAKLSFSGAEKAKWGDVIKKTARMLSIELEVRGRDLYEAVKKFFKDNNMPIPDDLVKESLKEMAEIKKLAKDRIRQEKLDAKKTRMKMPSEASGETITLLESTARNTQIKMEAKAAMEGARSVKEGLVALGVQIKEIIKEYNSKADVQKVTGGQYRSIINRLSKATSDTTIEKVLDYAFEVLDGAEYKKELGIAKGIVKDVASHNTLRKGIFGTAKEVGALFQKLDVKEMTVEELAEFNAMGNSLIVKDAVDIPRMNEMLVKFSGFISDVAKIKRATTHDQLKISINKAIGGISNITSMGDYLRLQRSLDNAKQKIGDMLLQGEDVMSSAQADALREILDGKDNLIGGVAKSYEAQLSEFKDKYISEIDTERKSVDKSKIDKLSPEVRDLVNSILGAKIEDITNLNATEIDSYNQFVKNIKEGAFTSESASLFQKIDAQKLKRMQTDPAINRINERNLWTKFKKGKTEGEILRWIRSKSPRFVEQFFGNDKTRGRLSSITAGVGIAFNKMNAFKDPMEKSLVDIHTDLTKGLGSSEAKDIERKYMGMFLVESSSRSKFIDTPEEFSIMNYAFGENFGKSKGFNTDPVEMTSRKTIYEKMLSDARNAGATKMLNEIEVIDIPKFEKVIMADARRAKYVNDIRRVLGETKGMAEASTLLNGRTFIDEGDRYMPLMAFGKSGFINDEVLAQALNYGATGIKMEANATNARTNKVFVAEIDPIEIMRAHINEVSRNYFVMPKLKAANEAIKLSSQEVSGENLSKDKADDNGILMLGRVYQKSLVSRTAFTLNGRHRTEYSNVTKTFDTLLSARKKGLIANPVRVIPEMTSNILRGSISSGKVISNAEYSKNKEVYEALIDEYFGGRQMSRWGDEATKSIFKRGFKNKLEKGATGIVTFSDTTIGSRLFANELNKEFTRIDRDRKLKENEANGRPINPKEIKGDEFDAKKYRDDPVYHEKVKEDVEQAAFWGLNRAEELFNNKNVMSQPELTTFIAGIIKGDPSHVSTKILDMLQGFNRNEFDQMRISWSRLRNGDGRQKLMGLRDMTSIPLSNFMYMQVRIASNILFKAGVLAVIGSQLSQNDKKKIADLTDPEAIAKNFGGSLIALTMGGSQNAYQMAIKAGSLAANAAGVDPKTTEWIYQYMQDELYIMAVPAYGSQESILKSAFPVPVLLDDFLQTGKAAGAFCSAIKAAYDGRRITEEQYLKIINGINIGMLYAYPNPGSGLIQNTLRPFIYKTEKAARALKSGSKSTTPDYLQDNGTKIDKVPDYLKQDNNSSGPDMPDYLKE